MQPQLSGFYAPPIFIIDTNWGESVNTNLTLNKVLRNGLQNLSSQNACAVSLRVSPVLFILHTVVKVKLLSADTSQLL